MSSTLGHVIVTRFNLPSPGAESLIRAKEGWLRTRVSLFETYCLPSVLAQTDVDFTWIIYVDPASPSWFTEWIESRAPGAYVVLARESVDPLRLIADIGEVLGTLPERLMTTNLDNDDAVSVDFVARLRSAAQSRTARTAVYLENGLILHTNRLYAHRDPVNAFCSVVEPGEGAVTCWVDWHNRLGEHMPTLALGGPPGWLQVVHGANVSNRVHGRLVSPRPQVGRFAVAVEDVPEPSAAELRADRLLHAPARRLRDGGRALAKRVVLRFGGTAWVHRLNATRASVSSALRRR